jgi:hypothetical protein
MPGVSHLWLKMSLFYSRSHWGHLVSRAIRPFLMEMQADGCLDRYMVYLGHMAGDHVRISVHAADDKKIEILRQADQYFLDYFGSHPSPDQIKDLNPVKSVSFFKDFPNNTIRYNVFKIDVIPPERMFPQVFEDLRYAFSKILLDIPGALLSDTRKMFRFSIALHIVAIRCYASANIDVALAAMELLLAEADLSNRRPKLVLGFEELFTNNSTEILSIYQSVWSDTTTDFPGLGSWSDSCVPVLRAMPTFKEYCFSISTVVHQHQGSDDDQHWYRILYLCYKAIKFSSGRRSYSLSV